MEKKKAGILFCTALLTLSIATGPAAALGAQSQSVATETSYTVLFADPRFTNISRISSGLSINSLGRAACTGSTTLYYEHDCTITMMLQQFKDNSWVDIKEWSEDYSGSGAKLLDKGYYVDKGYRYRMVTYVEIRSGGTLLETAICDSPIKDY